MRDAIPVNKRVAASLWRLATGDCYRSCGLMIGLAKPTVVKCCYEFIAEICRLQDEFIKFPSTRKKTKCAQRALQIMWFPVIDICCFAIGGTALWLDKP
jgi:hypothetical protein